MGTREKLRESGQALASVFRNTGLRRVQLAFVGSIVGDWAYAVAVAVYAFDQGGTTAVGVLAVIRHVDGAHPPVASIADRFPAQAGDARFRPHACRARVRRRRRDRRRRACPAVYGLAIATAIAATLPFGPSGLLPGLARDPGELTAANVASSTIESVGFFAGPALGGILLAVSDIQTVYIFNAVTFLWSAAFTIRIPPPLTARSEEEEEQKAEEGPGFFATASAGFRAIIGDRDLRLLIGVFCAQTVVAGALMVIVVALALDELDLGQSGVGYLDAVLGVGGLIGGFVALVLAQRGKLALDFGIGVMLWSAPLLAIAAWPTVWMAMIAMVLIGLGNSLVDINAFTILQRVVPDEVLGRVFAMESALIGAMAGGALLMPLLINTMGLRAGLLVVGGGVAILVGLPGRVTGSTRPFWLRSAATCSPDLALWSAARGDHRAPRPRADPRQATAEQVVIRRATRATVST
jgi:MFS family permease